MAVDLTSRYESLNRLNVVGDFRFILIDKFISYDSQVSFIDKLVLDIHRVLKYMGLSEEKAFGLDTSSVVVEKVPLIINQKKDIPLKRIHS